MKLLGILLLLFTPVMAQLYAQHDASLKSFRGVIIGENLKDGVTVSISVESNGVWYLVNVDRKNGVTSSFEGDVGDQVEVVYRDRPKLIYEKTYSIRADRVLRVNKAVNELADQRDGERIMRAYFDERLLQCGDSWWWVERYQSCGKGGCTIRNELHQGKGKTKFRFDGRYTPARGGSLAERLNGADPNPVEYEGTMWVIFEAARCINCLTDREWFGGENAKIGMAISKRHGQWGISEFSDPYNSVRKPTCAPNGHVLFADENLTPKSRFDGDYRLPDLKVR